MHLQVFSFLRKVFSASTRILVQKVVYLRDVKESP